MQFHLHGILEKRSKLGKRQVGEGIKDKEQDEGFLVMRIMFCIFTLYSVCQMPVCDNAP